MATKQTNNYKIKNMTQDKIIEIKADPRKFDLFIKQNKGFISEIALKFAKKHDDHFEDLYQIGCIALFKALDSFDPSRATLSTFAWGVIRNDLIQEIKRINKKRKFESSIELWAQVDNGNKSYPTYEYHETHWKSMLPIRQMEDSVLNKVMKDQCLEKFSDTERKIIELKQQGYKMKEIAKMLRKNLHSVRSMYFYATKKPEFKMLISA